ncbi:MAG: hypothetical protein M3413_11075 [Bacteroidota bacterium]|jgi:hypothetical protein|nr:hypothetical protein [Flavisolibacter sp.]MDQ3552063.1 hypothetical protein [Bacteroidota bacterium]
MKDNKNGDASTQQVQSNEVNKKQDLEMNRNNNERANENVNQNSFNEDSSANDVGSEITDGEAG